MAKPGTFPKGKSGNPGGKPKELIDIIALAKQHAPAAFNRIVEIANMSTPDLKSKMKANEIILDRAYGKAPQAVNVSGELSHTVIVNVRLKEIE